MGLKSFTNLQVTMKSSSQVVLPDSYVPGSKADENQTVYVNDFSVQDSLKSGDTPEPVEVLSQTVTIPAGGSYEIDLTAAKIVGAVDGNGDPDASEDLTGKKLMYIEVHARAANTAVINVAPSAADGYELFGSGNADGIDVPPDGHFAFYVKESSLDDAGASDHGITFSGTEDDICDVVMVFEA